jgi:pimeloyl-ACP methyl ester carboxylesterase
MKVLKYLSYVLPSWSAQKALGFFLTPQRYNPPAAEIPWQESGKSLLLNELHLFHWPASTSINHPSKGKVLLVHGWGGRGTQMHSFIQPLLDHGFEVFALDGPAHGRSKGQQTNAGEFSRAILKVGEHLGPLHGVVAHSFGAGCVTLAATQGLKINRSVLIACPADYGRVVETFLNFVQISPAARRAFTNRLVELAKVDPSEFNVGRLGSLLKHPSLIVHDENDKEVGYHNALEIQSAWREAQLLTTRGLGHRRILKDPQVVSDIVQFLALQKT